MRYSANLNIIIKAIEKATARMARDFIELENLQTNPVSAVKFANACYSKAKQVIAEDLIKLRPDYNLIFADGEKYIVNSKAEYSYIILPIDGLANLSRANPAFTAAVALEYTNAAGQKEAIALAINSVISNETYYCEKGFGAYVNNRRLRVSKRSLSDGSIVAVEDMDLKDEVVKSKIKNVSTRSYGCRTLELAYLASSKLDGALFQNNNYDFLKPFTLLIREAGGQVVEHDKLVIASNGIFDLTT